MSQKINVVVGKDIEHLVTQEDIDYTIKQIKSNTKYALWRQVKVVIDIDDENYLGFTVTNESQQFDRVRRITGYLTGTIDRWNNAKRQELRERVKHVKKGD